MAISGFKKGPATKKKQETKPQVQQQSQNLQGQTQVVKPQASSQPWQQPQAQ